jgi:hypothetical protein
MNTNPTNPTNIITFKKVTPRPSVIKRQWRLIDNNVGTILSVYTVHNKHPMYYILFCAGPVLIGHITQTFFEKTFPYYDNLQEAKNTLANFYIMYQVKMKLLSSS